MVLRRSILILLALLPLTVTVHASDLPETVLFMGSSTIHKWQRTMTGQFPQYNPVAECEIGTDFNYLLQIAPAAVKKHKPDRIVIYSGDNDLASREEDGRFVNSPEGVVRNFEKLVGVIRGLQNQTPIYVISIKPAPGRKELLSRVRETNALLKASAGKMSRVYFVDVFTSMIDDNNVIAEANFDPEDSMRIHLSPAGYELWTSILQKSMSDK